MRNHNFNTDDGSCQHCGQFADEIYRDGVDPVFDDCPGTSWEEGTLVISMILLALVVIACIAISS